MSFDWDCVECAGVANWLWRTDQEMAIVENWWDSIVVRCVCVWFVVFSSWWRGKKKLVPLVSHHSTRSAHDGRERVDTIETISYQWEMNMVGVQQHTTRTFLSIGYPFGVGWIVMQREIEQKAYRKAVVPDYCQTNGRIISVTVDIFVLTSRYQTGKSHGNRLAVVYCDLSSTWEYQRARLLFSYMEWTFKTLYRMFYSILGFAAFYNEEKSCRWVHIRGLLLCVKNEKLPPKKKKWKTSGGRAGNSICCYFFWASRLLCWILHSWWFIASLCMLDIYGQVLRVLNESHYKSTVDISTRYF